MGFDLDIQVEEWTNEDRSWLGSRLGTQENKSVTLDLSLFDWETTFTDLIIPSGVALAQADGGHYGPYAHTGPTNEVQTITRTATGGTVDITFDGETAAGVSIVAATTAEQVKAILTSLSNIDEDDVNVAGSAGGPFTVTFTGQYAGEDVPELVIDDSDATGGTVTVATTTAGAGEEGDPEPGLETGVGLLFNSQPMIGDGTGLVGVPLFWCGRVVESKLPANHGVDAGFKADVPTLHFE